MTTSIHHYISGLGQCNMQENEIKGAIIAKEKVNTVLLVI